MRHFERKARPVTKLNECPHFNTPFLCPLTLPHIAENLLHFVDIVCCCLVLFPIVGQVRSLESALTSESASKATERTITKLTLFRHFYVLVIAYIYFTRILVFLVSTLLTYKHSWLAHFFNEGGTLLFYATTGWKFRPKKQNPYLELSQLDRDGEDDDDEEDDRSSSR